MIVGVIASLSAVAPVRAQSACAADRNGDGVVNANDLALVLSSWGGCSGCAGDTNSDGFVDGVDLALILNRWGASCAPTVVAITPNAGPLAGGVAVTIAGDNLLDPSSVTFGGAPATILASTRNAVSVLAPVRPAGTATVAVTTLGGTVYAGSFTYFGAPSIDTASPSTGLAVGGTSVTITGSGFYGSPTVRFGKLAATSVTVVSPTQLVAVTPAGAAGATVGVSVATESGVASAPAAFSFVAFIVPSWATLLEGAPDPAVVTNQLLREAIVATGYAWRVRDNASQIEMLLVPPGTFNMGCSEGSVDSACNPWELPVHAVTLTDAYYIGRYEVTQAQWTARMGSNPSQYQGAGFPNAPNRPVEKVSWLMAEGFLAATGLRLPTEAEWEFACRAGTSTPFHSMPGYPNGTTNDALATEIAWYYFNTCSGGAGCETNPVGLKAANALGLHDMLGNVWEWTNDRYADYSSDAQTNPTGAPSGTSRVIRGGSWSSGTFNVRSSERAFNAQTASFSSIGFRVARNP